MTKKAFDKIMAGAEAALAHARGDKSKGVAHIVRAPERIDVAAIRARYKLTQAAFAKKYGFDLRALQEWEQGRRNPDRATRILFRVIEKEPKAVERALRSA